MNKDTKVKVVNRSFGSVGYSIPEMGINRIFQYKEEKEISFGELEALSWIPGGPVILKENLVIRDEEALKELLPSVEPEYFYTEDDVKELLLKGSIESFLDCLDFAPTGVLEIVKNLAVDLPLNDVAKRQAILDKLGFDVTRAIEIKNTKFDDGSEDEEEAKKARRTQTTPIQKSSVPQRRVAIPIPTQE